MKTSSPYFLNFFFLYMVHACMGMCICTQLLLHVKARFIRSLLLFSNLSFNLLSSTEPKAHEWAKWPGYWAPRIFKSPLPSTGITGMCHHAHFRKLKCLRGRKTFYKETRSNVLIRYILIALLSTKQLIWPTTKENYIMLHVRETLSFPFLPTIQLWTHYVE